MGGGEQRAPVGAVAAAAGALVVVVGLAWGYLLLGAGVPMDQMGMPMGSMAMAWSAGYAALLFAMWAVMMVAMMFPAAAPMVLTFAAVDRRRRRQGGAPGTAAAFVLGYALVWTSFAAAAVGLQYILSQAALLSPTMATTSRAVSGAILVGAGIYQWTPLKQACLRWCRSPLDFLLRNWRPGREGALRLGLLHGAYCLGCCWAAMLLLFVGGVMNLVWVAGLTLFVVAEKTLPAGGWLSRLAGAALMLWGLDVLLI